MSFYSITNGSMMRNQISRQKEDTVLIYINMLSKISEFPGNLVRKLSLIVNLELYSRVFHPPWEEKPSYMFLILTENI